MNKLILVILILTLGACTDDTVSISEPELEKTNEDNQQSSNDIDPIFPSEPDPPVIPAEQDTQDPEPSQAAVGAKQSSLELLTKANLVNKVSQYRWDEIFGGYHHVGREPRYDLVFYLNWNIVSDIPPVTIIRRNFRVESCINQNLRDFGLEAPDISHVWFIGDSRHKGSIGGSSINNEYIGSIDLVDGSYVLIIDEYHVHNAESGLVESLYAKAHFHARRSQSLATGHYIDSIEGECAQSTRQ